jgi:glucose-6-phosphate dehydrogenase assembly protein OpcA
MSLEVEGQAGTFGARNETPSFGRLVIGDMAWTRLDGFRQALAAIFDEGHRAEYLDGLTRLEVIGSRGARQPVTSAELLMAAWIASRAGYSSPAWAQGGVSMKLAGSGSRALIGFSGGRSTNGTMPLRGVRMEAHLGRNRLELELMSVQGEGHLSLRETGTRTISRTVHMPHPDEAEVLSRELARLGRDRVYEDALMSAARIQAAQTS